MSETSDQLSAQALKDRLSPHPWAFGVGMGGTPDAPAMHVYCTRRLKRWELEQVPGLWDGVPVRYVQLKGRPRPAKAKVPIAR